MSTRHRRQRLMVAFSLRSARFLSNASVLYRVRFSRGGMGIAAIAWYLSLKRSACPARALESCGPLPRGAPSVTPCGVEGVLVLAPEPVIERPSERPFFVGLRWSRATWGASRPGTNSPYRSAEPLFRTILVPTPTPCTPSWASWR